MARSLHPALARSIARAWEQTAEIPTERRETLERIAGWIRARKAAGHSAPLLFVCTHNSRRSHMGQLWAAAAAAHFGVEAVPTFSGGTQVTAFDPRAVAALQRAGFSVGAGAGDNPRYAVSFGPDGPVLSAWSKTYDDEANPTRGFAAIMTCSEADQACPQVAGADLRISLPYEDPKLADDTPAETAAYDERSGQIAAQMLYLFSCV